MTFYPTNLWPQIVTTPLQETPNIPVSETQSRLRIRKLTHMTRIPLFLVVNQYCTYLSVWTSRWNLDMGDSHGYYRDRYMNIDSEGEY